MCVIAAYIGKKQAAPVLLDMMARLEGLAGGYYTGLATIDSGKLHWRKVVGDLARLKSTTDAESLPGCIGLAHARPKCGGDVEWGHPFIACDDLVAYIANGAAGKWEKDPRRPALARRLAREGHRYHAVAPCSPEEAAKTPTLEDGSKVHASDVMAHAIEEALKLTGDPERAIAQSFINAPAEIVGMYITPLHPDRIFGARWNMPVCIGMDDDGAYAASSPEGFPPHLRWWMRVPPSSAFTLSAERFAIAPLGKPSEAMVDDIDRTAAREAILWAIQNSEGLHVEDLLKLMDPLSKSEGVKVRYDAVYQTLHELMKEGAIRRRVDQVPGAAEGVMATRFFHEIADGGAPKTGAAATA